MWRDDRQKVVVQGNGGIGFGGLLTIVFIVLKLTGTISWSWFWVLSPILIPLFIVLGFLGIALIALALD